MSEVVRVDSLVIFLHEEVDVSQKTGFPFEAVAKSE